ncbi:MAG TPA: NAD(P)/FAD-dependent oxidoreductase [Vicinamibacterales bacterium]|nr:NAD(P)/FAD-dependent oxidoreductase [Vicinamibacterales bacterium]
MFDAIVVGARCAGSPAAMLLARRGFKVLLVDKASFPSDTISTHILWPHGAEILGRWGLLQRLAATRVPPICRRMRFDVGPFALSGTIPDANDGMGGFCPRRTVLDALLVSAAAESGVEVRESFTVDELIVADGTVIGIRGHARGRKPVEERARIVVGADGVNSFVARAVKAPEYDVEPAAACGYYTYLSGVRQDDIELYVRDHVAFGGAPTNDDLHLLMVNWPARDFPAVRRDIEGHVWRALEGAPDFLARMREGRREEKWYGAAGVPGYFRKPYGRGWALAGDASYNRDPITAQGISDAFIDAELLAEALGKWLAGDGAFEEVMAGHEAARNERVRPMYEFTTHLAALEPAPPEMRALFAALRHNQDATNAFLSAITGAIPLPDFMSHDNIGRIMAAANERERSTSCT